VDNTATVASVGTKDVLVGGLAKGGKGYFALDVTDPKAMTKDKVMWEFPNSSTASYADDMGYSFSTAFIANTKAAGKVVIFGNGYGSANGYAELFVLNANTGAVIRRFNTEVGDCNGLSTPAVIDEDQDGYVDYVYAGDLKGNMWKIDLRADNDPANWRFYYMDSSSKPEPLITVKNKSGAVQPITEAPDVMLDCAALDVKDRRGLMVVFGTGQYLTTDDLSDTTVQSFYGIWDWGEYWESTLGDLSTAQSKYLGTPDSTRQLSNLPGTQLREQTFIYQDTQWGVLTDTPTDWYAHPFNADSTGKDMGWCFDMPDSGERSLRDPLIRKGNVVMISTIPSTSPCDSGGSSAIYIVNACTGGQTYKPEFDVNNDKTIDSNDVIGGKPPARDKITKIIYDPTEITDLLLLPDSSGDIDPMTITTNRAGMFFWRVLDQ
jgi:type IV pilus assembly protein PilY1